MAVYTGAGNRLRHVPTDGFFCFPMFFGRERRWILWGKSSAGQRRTSWEAWGGLPRIVELLVENELFHGPSLASKFNLKTQEIKPQLIVPE